MATQCKLVKRRESTGSGAHEKKVSVTRKIQLVGAEKCMSEVEDNAESLVREN